MNKAIIFFTVLQLLVLCSFLPAQDIFEGLELPEVMEADERISLAISNENYFVTPGDIYQLNYQPAEEIMTILIPVETDYSLNLGILGSIAGYGLTFPELKSRVERKFSSAYPQSTPSLTIYSLSMFQVFITGEVPQSRYVNAWGLSRLGEIVKDNIGPYTSIRTIQIKDNKGKIKTYDLFKGLILGDAKHNPFVKSGNVIILSRREKQIELKGEIYRPGTYEILKTDTFSDIIDVYGGDFTEKANTSSIRIERTFDNTLEVRNYDAIADKKADSILEDRDIIYIEPVYRDIPIVFIEGAIQGMSDDERVSEEPGNQVHNVITQPFFTGDTLYDVMNKIRNSLIPDADLANSFILRGTDNETIPVNLQTLLYSHDLSHNPKIENFDRIIIPRKALIVIVNGDVRNPGNYSFVPQQKYIYYLGIAGGTVNGSVEENATIIINKEGKRKNLDDYIEIGDMIIIKRATVIVSGAVITPGEYPYIPEKLCFYYINLAGGINYDRNDGHRIVVRNSEHKKKKKDELINPGDSIFIPSSGFSYNFNRYTAIIGTSLSIIVSTILLWNQFGPSSSEGN